jgi:hypothetical protein
MSGRPLLEIPQGGPRAVAEISEALRDARVSGLLDCAAGRAAVAASSRSGIVLMRQRGASIRVIARWFGISP